MMGLRGKLREMRRARLNEVRVASPCHVDWERMAGDEQVRFCDSCQLHVYNLSAMDVEAAAELIAEREGRVCIRFFRRADGTVLTQDCPVGADRARRKRQAVVSGTVVGTAAAAMLASAVFIPLHETLSRPVMGMAVMPVREAPMVPAEPAMGSPLPGEATMGKVAVQHEMDRVAGLGEMGKSPKRPGAKE